MIEINLLSEELKVKHKKIGKISIEAKYFTYLIPLIFALLIFVHICLAVAGIAMNLHFGILSSNWKKFKPQREALDNLKKKYDVLASNAKLIQELDNRRLNWSGKLNRLSRDLPPGVWFNEIHVSQKEFLLKASVFSLQKDEMALIKRFIDSLKSDTYFLKGFTSPELGSVQKRSAGGYDVVDFILTAKLRAK